ncbi:MAG: glycosyltransferase [Ruminococcus sp.]|nr:glycosyltransferase [Ruminococcus sp.]
MFKDKVTIVVPIYKVEEYLDRCVKSLLVQTYTNLEIILVDDGSPDKCPQLCDDYARQYNNISVVHKKNGGLASARNAGLKVATGKYIFFVDSDDWIDPNTIEDLYAIAEKKNVDFVRFRPMYAGWPNHADGDLCDFGTEKGMTEGLYTRDRIVNEVFPRLLATPQLTFGVIVSACRSLYKTEFLKINNLFFDEDVKYSEDSIFSAKLVYATNSFYYLDGPRYYHYFYNSASISKSFRADRWESCQRLVYRFDEFFADNKTYDFEEQLWLQKIFSVLSALSQRGLITNKKDRKNYCKLICNDNITKSAFKHLNLVDVPWKLYVYLLIIRYRQAWLLAII